MLGSKEWCWEPCSSLQMAHKLYSISRGAFVPIHGRGSFANEAGAIERTSVIWFKNHDHPSLPLPDCPRYPLTAGWAGGQVSLSEHEVINLELWWQYFSAPTSRIRPPSMSNSILCFFIYLWLEITVFEGIMHAVFLRPLKNRVRLI